MPVANDDAAALVEVLGVVGDASNGDSVDSEYGDDEITDSDEDVNDYYDEELDKERL